MWRPALSGESLERWEKAREVFRAALAAPVGLEKEGLACASIVEGIRACEGLAVRYADADPSKCVGILPEFKVKEHGITGICSGFSHGVAYLDVAKFASYLVE